MKKNRILKIFGILAAIFLVVIVGTIIAFRVMYPPEKIQAMIVPHIEKALGRGVKVERAAMTFFPSLGVSLKTVEIANTSRAGYSDEPFITLDQFKVQIGVSSIFKGHPVINKVIIKKPVVRLELDTSGAYNYADLGFLKDTTKQPRKSSVPALPIPVSLKKLIVEDGTMTYHDNRNGQDIVIGDIDQVIRVSLDKELRNINTDGTLTLDSISLKLSEDAKPLSDYTVAITHDINANIIEENVAIKKVRISIQGVDFDIGGKVSNFGTTPELDLKLESGNMKIDEVLTAIPVELVPVVAKLSTKGTADLAIGVNGKIEKEKPVPIKGTCVLKDVTIKHVELPKSVNNLNADLAFTGNDLSINEMNMKLGANPIELKGHIKEFKEPQVAMRMLADIDLDDMKDVFKLPKDAYLSGKLHSDIDAKGLVDPSDPSKLSVDGAIEMKKVVVQWPPLTKRANVDGTISLTSQKIQNAINATIGKSSTQLNATITNYLGLIVKDSTKQGSRPNLTFTMNSPYFNVDEFLPQDKEKEQSDGKKGKAKPIVAPLPGVDTKGTIAIKQLVYKGMQLDNVNARVSSINDIADVIVNARFGGGTIDESVRADFTNASDAIVTNKLVVSNVEVNKLLDQGSGFLDPSTPLNRHIKKASNVLFGKVNLTSTISGSGNTADAITKSLTGQISTKINNGKITKDGIVERVAGVTDKFISFGDISFRDLSAMIKIQNEKLLFEQLQIDSDVGNWDVDGTVGFDAGLAMNVSNRLPRGASQKITGLQSKGKSTVKNLLQGSQFAGASQYIDGVGIPADNQGRVTLKLGIGGSVSDPKVSFKGFGEGTAGASEESSPKEKVLQNVQENIQEQKEQLEQKLAEEKRLAEQKMKEEAARKQKNLEEKRKKLEAEAQKKKEKLKNDAANKLKKLF